MYVIIAGYIRLNTLTFLTQVWVRIWLKQGIFMIAETNAHLVDILNEEQNWTAPQITTARDVTYNSFDITTNAVTRKYATGYRQMANFARFNLTHWAITNMNPTSSETEQWGGGSK